MHNQLERDSSSSIRCQVVVLWIDWYAYHLARFEGLQSVFGRNGEVAGLEMVGGVGVHAGLNFRQERPAHVPVETLLPGSSWRAASKLKLSRLIWRRLSQLNPEMVLVPGYYTLPAVVAALWARLHGRQSVLMTESTVWDHKRSLWKERVKSVVMRTLFNWAVTGGTAHVRYLHELGFPAGRIAHYYDVVGNERLQEEAAYLRDRSSAADSGVPAPYFLFIGRLADEKNVAGLVHAWHTYREQGGTWSLVIAGDGPQREQLQTGSRALRYARDVLFVGHKATRELVPYFSFAAVFVLPSKREPWGLVVNEAMAAGLPVIVSSACGCAGDLVHPHRNGLIFDPESRSELTACMHAMEHLRPEERSEMGAASLQIIQPFSPHNFGLEIARILNHTKKHVAHANAGQESLA